MSKHFIFADTHHGSEKVVDYLKKKAGKGKIAVSSTGDFFCYAANERAPMHLKHVWNKAYKSGDKEAMKKHEPDWVRKVVAPGTRKSGENLQELKGHIQGGRVHAIMGNSDYAVGRITEKRVGAGLREMLGGSDSAVNHIDEIQVRKDGNTTFVYLPHDIRLLSKYKDNNYTTVKARLHKDKHYQDRLETVADKIGKYNTKNVVVLMHEAPKPERWYGQGTPKSKQRLPAPLKAHYNSVLDQIVQTSPGKHVQVFHGHLHESEKKRYQYKGVKTRLLDIGDVVAYDTEKGTYRTKKAA
jgi:hypothetical protein